MNDGLQSLQQDLAAMKENGSDCHDPVNFRYIESMVERAATQGETVATILAEKARKAFTDYQQATTQTIENGRALLRDIAEDFPEDFTDAQTLQKQGRVDQLQKLIDRKRRRPDTAGDLAALNTILAQHASTMTDDPEDSPVEELLRIQEMDVFKALLQETPGKSGIAAPANQELRSVRRFRNAQVKRNADKLVTRAVAEIPDGSGPLNSQRLAAQFLAAMRDLSPHYLSRFVTYMDSLFWLEQTDKEKQS